MQILILLVFISIVSAIRINLTAQSNYTNPLAITGADPTVVDGKDGKYYVFVTDGNNTTRYTSTDLVTWGSKRSNVFAGQAPHVFFDSHSSKWYMKVSGGTGDATSASANTFTSVSSNLSGFDPCYFTDTDGKSYLSQGGVWVTHNVYEAQSATQIKTAYHTEFINLWFGFVYEGTWMQKHKDTYYMVYSIGGGANMNYRLAYATSKSPVGPFITQTWSMDACFLRQSDIESIWGPGHHCTIADKNGVIWVYYQQKESGVDNVWDRKVAVDPMWFDASGIPMMRPTRGKLCPGPNSAFDVIWPVVNASSAIIQAENYNGSAIIKLNNGGSGKVVENIQSRSHIAYRNIDFGTGSSGFEAQIACGVTEKKGIVATIEIHLDGVHGPIVGMCEVTNSGSFTTYKQVSCKLNQIVTGKHDVILVVNGYKPNLELCRLDYFKFNTSVIAPCNQPPVTVNDIIEVVQGKTVTIDVLMNDSDPDGQKINISGIQSKSNISSSNNVSINTTTGRIVYTAPATFNGDDAFFYMSHDSVNGFTQGEVRVRVTNATGAFQEQNEMLVIEAENYHSMNANSDISSWVKESSVAGFSGTGYISTPDNGTQNTDETKGARAAYNLEIHKPGLYYVWARVYNTSTSNNATNVLVSFDFANVPWTTFVAYSSAPITSNTLNSWVWVKCATIQSLKDGIFNLYAIRNLDGHKIDKFVLTTDANYDPSAVNGGVGSNQSPMFLYDLTVYGGNGSGSYTSGSIVNVSAFAPPLNHQFNQWTGSIAGLTDVFSASTTYTIASSHDYITASYKLTTDLNASNLDEIGVYPNPVKDWLYIPNSLGIFDYSILDLNGRIVLSEKVNGLEMIQVNVEKLVPGLFVIQIKNSNGASSYSYFCKL